VIEKIRSVFNSRFRHWGLNIPSDDFAHRKRGRIESAGWIIEYLFDSDDEGEYLDYYASHRMTEDEHVRIRADGRCEDLPSISGLHEISEDPVETARLTAQHVAENRRILEMLRAKGFALDPDDA